VHQANINEVEEIIGRSKRGFFFLFLFLLTYLFINVHWDAKLFPLPHILTFNKPQIGHHNLLINCVTKKKKKKLKNKFMSLCFALILRVIPIPIVNVFMSTFSSQYRTRQ
jgi:hypothetical protein